MIIKKFYKTKKEFEEFHAKLKLCPCPHCSKTGFLNLHGYLKGFPENGKEKIKKGRRIYCSNKNKKGGCGRTFSILDASYIKNFRISAKTIWHLLEKVKDGSSKAEALRTSGSTMGETTVYRIFRKFKYNQPRIRTLLAGVREPPRLKGVKDPVIQTIIHLKSAFRKFVCPVARFQYHFQTSFF